MMKRMWIWMIGVALVAVIPAAAEDADAILGVWSTQDDKALVEIYRSGERYDGRITWLKEPTYEDGTQKIDKNNPDETKWQNPIIGLVLVKDFIYKGSQQWVDGSIYDPDNGKTYSCKMTLKGDELHVRGFIGISLIGRSQVWRRR